MSVLQDNNTRWLDVELGTRAVAKLLDCKYVPYPLGTKKPFQEPEPSAPTDRHLYMLLPHAIAVFPPHQNYDLVCCATMSAKTFFAMAVEKLGVEFDQPPTGDEDCISVVFTGLPDKEKNQKYRVTFTIHYCRIAHVNGHLLSTPEQIPLGEWLPNPDVLARLHDARHMVKKVRGLDATADAAKVVAPSSIEYRASIVQLITWAVSCGVLAPRINMLTSEMLVFCLDQGYADLDIRGAHNQISQKTIARLLEECMYRLVMGIHIRRGHLSIVTPSGRTLGYSVSRRDTTTMATEVIKRAITRDMTSVSNIALDMPAGRDRFRAEHEFYLKITTRCWHPKSLGLLALNIYPILLQVEDMVIKIFEGLIVTQIWPFHNRSPGDMSLNEGWVNYIGISQAIPDRQRIDFPSVVRERLDEDTQFDIEAMCLNHELLDRSCSHIDIRVKSQQELFGDEVPAYTGLSTDEGMDFDFILSGPVGGTPIFKLAINDMLKDLYEDLREEGDLENFLNNPPSTPIGHTPQIASAADEDLIKRVEKLRTQEEAEKKYVGKGKAKEVPAPSSITASTASSSSLETSDLPSAGTAPADDTVPKRRFRTAAQTIDRLRHDPRHAAVWYEVGYEDRFTEDLMWKPLDEWQAHTEEEDFIPEHRVRQIRRMTHGGDDKWVIWDRDRRLDVTDAAQ